MLQNYEAEHLFLRQNVVEVYAATIGINRAKWISINNNKYDAALSIMRKNRFDILPIESATNITGYYRTNTWGNFTDITELSVSYKDVVACDMRLYDLIKSFANDNRHFYFLVNENRITGLISIAHLNARQVKIYLFGLLSELEIEVGTLIADSISNTQLIELISTIVSPEKYIKIQEHFLEDQQQGVERSYIEYLYLPDLVKIIKIVDLYEKFGFKKKQVDDFNGLVTLRNMVAHPMKSLVSDLKSVQKLWERINRIEDILFRLRIRQKI